jgi:hypothetical protein
MSCPLLMLLPLLVVGARAYSAPGTGPSKPTRTAELQQTIAVRPDEFPDASKNAKVALAAGAVVGFATLATDLAALDLSAHVEAAVAVATGAAFITGDDSLPGALLGVVGNLTLGVGSAMHRHDVGLVSRAVLEVVSEAVVEAAAQRAEEQRQWEAEQATLALLRAEGAQTVARREEAQRLLPGRLRLLELREDGQRVIATREARAAALPRVARYLQLKRDGEAVIAARQAKVRALPRMRTVLRMIDRSPLLSLHDFHELELTAPAGADEPSAAGPRHCDQMM